MELCWPRSVSASAGRGCRDRDGDEPARDLGACVRARSRGQRDGVRDARSSETAAVRAHGRERKTACVSRHDVPGWAAALGDGAGDAGGGAVSDERTLLVTYMATILFVISLATVGTESWSAGAQAGGVSIQCIPPRKIWIAMDSRPVAMVPNETNGHRLLRFIPTYDMAKWLASPHGPVPKCPTR